MAFAEMEPARVKKLVGGFCERRVPRAVRDKLRLECSVQRHDVELYEVRPSCKTPAEEMRTPVTKFRFVRTANTCRLHWMRQDFKWHAHEPCASSRRLEHLVDAADRNEAGYYFG